MSFGHTGFAKEQNDTHEGKVLHIVLLVKFHVLTTLCAGATNGILVSSLLESAWKGYNLVWQLLNLICRPFNTLVVMTLDEKIRYGMVALAGASVVFATLGVHINPLDICGGMGTT
jgi:hypothetical protein